MVVRDQHDWPMLTIGTFRPITTLKFVLMFAYMYMHILENIMRHKRIYLKNAPRKQYICQSFISVDLDPVKSTPDRNNAGK